MDLHVPVMHLAAGGVNPLDFDPTAFLLTLIVFLVLFGLLLKFAWNPILDALDNRRRRIEEAVETAERARQEAERLLAEHKKSVADTERQVAARLEEGRRLAQKQSDEILARAQEEAQAERERVKREIDGERQKALADIRAEAVRLSRLIAEKTLSRKVDEEDHRRLAAEVLTTLR